jgi:hypothetical protein
MRVNLSVAIVAMVYRNTTQPNNNNTYDHCVAPNSSNSTQPPVS